MIERRAAETVLRLAEQFPVIAVTGPRQSGKSTLVQSVFGGKQYVTFDDASVRALAESNPGDFVRAFKAGAIFDEAQKVPGIFDAIKLAVDHGAYEPGRFVLTGSSNFRLRSKIRESLAGRIGMVQLLPFSVAELAAAGKLTEDPYDLAFRGAYPPLYDERKHFIRDDWMENYIDTYVERDISEFVNPSNLSLFKKFVQICALYSGQMLNMEGISRDTGVSATTIRTWLSMLESSYIVHLLEPDTNNLGRSIVKTPKLYFTDPGLLCYLLRLSSKEDLLLSRHKGAVIETMAVAELIKARYNNGKKPLLTYFRDHNGFEIDIIGDWQKTFALEIKSNSATEGKLSANVRKYIDLRDPDIRGSVYYLGNITCNINGIDYVSWKDWGEVAYQ